MRLDDAGLAALLDAAGAEGSAPLPDPALEPAVVVLRDAPVRLDVVVAGTSRLEHRVWASPGLAVAVLGVRPDLHQVLLLPPSHLTAALVRVTRLRPRRVGDRQPRGYPGARVPDLVDPDLAVRAAALADASASWAWRLGVAWAAGRTEVVATDGEHGLHLADPDADVLVPVSNTTAYRIFSTALPVQALAAG